MGGCPFPLLKKLLGEDNLRVRIGNEVPFIGKGLHMSPEGKVQDVLIHIGKGLCVQKLKTSLCPLASAYLLQIQGKNSGMK